MILGDLPTRKRTEQTPPPNRRAGRIRIIAMMAGVFLSFVLVIQNLYVLQIRQQGQFLNQIDETSIFERRIPATRGLIYDRNGEALVRNAPSYQVAILPYKQFQRANRVERRILRVDVFNRLANLINQPGVTAGDIFARVLQATNDQRAYEPVVVADNVPRETALYIQELSYTMPGVIVQEAGSRVYPNNALLGHVLGYTAKIPQEAQQNYDRALYDIENDRVGVAGIEKIVETELRGKKGQIFEIRDVAGEVIEVLGTPISPTKGNNVYLTLDLRLQRIISDALIPIMQVREVQIGSVVALDPRNGEILGMVSVPGLDNNLFARGITNDELKALNEDIYKPLSNKATQFPPPPGSTFKILTAIALLEEGYVTPNTIINDPGFFELPNDPRQQRFFCWIGLRGGSHGPQRLTDALRNSCNTYFRKAVGGFEPEGIQALGPDLLAKWAEEFGVGVPNDVKLSYVTGNAPTVDWKRRTHGEQWFTGDSYNAAIGQGYVQATPLEMANIIATIANGGTLWQPQIVREIRDADGQVIKPFEPKKIRDVNVRPATMALVQQSLRDVVNTGTAGESRIEGFEYAGKTGTAEFCDDIAFELKICKPPGSKDQPTHAWFVAYAPAENPTLALAVFIWNGGQGSSVAAPVAQRIINAYFELGVAEDKLQKVTKDIGTSE
jgi:penicillin-binding protein 2